MQGIIPDLTIMLITSPETGIKRINQNSLREVNRLDKEHISFHYKVHQAYLDLIKNDQTNSIKVVDAEKDLDNVFNDVYKIVRNAIEAKYGI
jgi:dTMP kinase